MNPVEKLIAQKLYIYNGNSNGYSNSGSTSPGLNVKLITSIDFTWCSIQVCESDVKHVLTSSHLGDCIS